MARNEDGFWATGPFTAAEGLCCCCCGEEIGGQKAVTRTATGASCLPCFESGELEQKEIRVRQRARQSSRPFRGSFPGIKGGR